ncbi:H(+)-transporting V0 sector ATPase subunit a [Ascosphaera pollenicola]|nr:H(+)-transporting V0 sector ATPase subunit a [Ascosphaera pollenicola]
MSLSTKFRGVHLSSTDAGANPSRATSPGGDPVLPPPNPNDPLEDPCSKARLRPRTYPYFDFLPYAIEEEEERQRNLNEILKHLYISIQSGDFSPGAVHWTRELRGWLSLKFDPTREQRIRLVKLYYELALAPGIDPAVAERFASMFMHLTKRKHYLRPIKDLILDWKPLYREIKLFVLPSQSGLVHSTNLQRSIKTLTKICSFAQLYFDPNDLPLMLEEFLPHFTTSFTEGAFVVIGLINLFIPTSPPPAPDFDENLLPQNYLPTYFHLWGLINRSKAADIALLDIFSRMARDTLGCKYIPFDEFGIFTKDQTSLIFTAILRLLEIPIGQATSAYSTVVDFSAGLGIMLDRDPRKHPAAHIIARWIAMSISPKCMDAKDSIMSQLEALIEAVETMFHPSNIGHWSRPLAQLVHSLADFFIMRWHRESNGEMDIPEDRKLNDAVKRRFVLCLRDVTFMGLYSKSGTMMSLALSTLQCLAELEPSLILPRALQSIYPSLQGLVEVHRTTSSLRALQVLSRTMIRTKGFRCHIPALLGLTLPGIDANDLEKSLYTLSFLQSVCYNIPFEDMTAGRDDVQGNMLAMQWITGEIERMEIEGADVEMDYERDLDDRDEEMILRSSTTGFGEFLTSFLGRVFTLVENLPDASRVRSGSPEENVLNTLPAVFTPLLASLSPELYEIALHKISSFISDHVIHQARDAMAFICNALCKANPPKALKTLIPNLIASIRTEINENGAASTRTTGSDILPRDRALVWNVSMLSMCVVHVGREIINYKDELFAIAVFMQEKCKGIPTVHVSNFVHHLLLNLTGTYIVDYDLFEPQVRQKGVTLEQWGQRQSIDELTVKWHVPQRDEIEFAVDIFRSQAGGAIEQLQSLISETSAIKPDGSGKEWSDEVSRKLVLLRLILSGVSRLFDNKAVSKDGTVGKSEEQVQKEKEKTGDVGEAMELDDDGETARPDSILDSTDDSVFRKTFHYPTGYPLQEDDPLYIEIHRLRHCTGEVIHDVHEYLRKNQPDDVSCFTSLFSVYRSWFVDVSIERSAHVLDRVSKLLQADSQPYQVSGVRKDYPRPILIRRANLYHIQRLRQNATPRPRTKLDEKLLLDLAHSSVSAYTDNRRNAQVAAESALKVIWGGRILIIPPLLEALQEGVRDNDYPKLKGALFSLLYGSLAKVLGRHWKYTPTLIRTFIAANESDRPSVQRICAGAVYQVMDYGRAQEKLAVLDAEVIGCIAPEEHVSETIERNRKTFLQKWESIEEKKAELCDELVEIAKKSHWKIASRVVAMVVGMGLRFETIAKPELLELIVKGTVDYHPGLRAVYSQALMSLFTLIDIRAVCNHNYEDYVLRKEYYPGKLEVATKPQDPNWTQEYLDSFAKPEAEYYVDHDSPGWLVWGKTLPAYKVNMKSDIEYDAKEWETRKQMGQYFDREWLRDYFKYLKQEPRDTSADRYRMSAAMTLLYVFELMLRDGLTKLTFEEVKEEIVAVYEDGSDKHQHRATAEIFGGLLSAVFDTALETRTKVWEYVFPLVRDILSDNLTPENIHYWNTFLHTITQCRDPRRSWPLVDWLTSFRLDMSSNAAFKESSKIQLLHQCILDVGWHFRLEKPIVQDFLDHLDHPYKGVREAMGHTLGTIMRTRYYEAYPDVPTLIAAQKKTSSTGVRPYKPPADFVQMITKVFNQLEKWRHERVPGQQTTSSYSSGCKTVVLWLDSMLTSHECTTLLEFFPNLFTEQLLHMMDVKEDPELQSHAYHVFRHLPNIPHPLGEDTAFIDELIRIGRNSQYWHQRLRVMVNMQIIYFRRLFIINPEDREKLFECVASMLEDSQHEVRNGASTTLSGMIRCSPVGLRSQLVLGFRDRFTKMLIENPMPKKPKGVLSGVTSKTSTGTSTPTPEYTKLLITRHAAVSGLGALVSAYPYASPPPAWMPEVLQTLSNKAAGDPGIVGQGAKSIIGDFKKTRQDTWHIDVKAFSSDQLEDLSGVLWKSYFA